MQTDSAAPSLNDARDEYTVLLQCIRRALQLHREPLAFPPAGFAWPRLIELADRHDVIPLLNARLTRLSFGSRPMSGSGWIAIGAP